MVTLVNKVTGIQTTDLETVYAYAAADDDGTWPDDDSHESFLAAPNMAYAPTMVQL